MVVVAAGVTSVLFVAMVLASLAYNPPAVGPGLPGRDPGGGRPPVTARADRASGPRGGTVRGGLRDPAGVGAGREGGRGDVTTLEGFVHLWSILVVVNLVDLVVVDWLIGVCWDPSFLSTPEIEPHLHHNTYRFHLVEHAKGTVMLTVAALVLGWLVSL